VASAGSDDDDDDGAAGVGQRPNVDLSRVAWKRVDWARLETEFFPQLLKLYAKCVKALAGGHVPSAWAAGMVFLEDCVLAAARKEHKATMSRAKGKSVQSLMAKLGKLEPALRARIDAERENPVLEETDEEDGAAGAGPGGAGAGEPEEIEWTEETVQKKIDELIALRGKRGTKLEAMLAQWEALLEVIECKAQAFAVRVHMLSSRFDSASSLLTFMPLDLWNECRAGVAALLDEAESDAEIKAMVAASSALAAARAVGATAAAAAAATSTATAPELLAGNLVRTSVAAFSARLDDELVKSLQNMDHHTDRYVQRLGDEKVLLALLERASDFYDGLGERATGTALCFRRLEHLYFVVDTDRDAEPPKGLYPVLPPGAEASTAADSPLARATAPLRGDVTPLVQSLSARVLREGTDPVSSIRATLCLVYHHAICGRYHTARDVLLMSGLHSVLEADVSTQVLYNRCTAVMGLAAFKLGLLRDAHTCLQEVCSSGRTRELVGQGTGPRFGADRSAEQERAEKRRQLPWHMHVPLEALEMAHLASAMYLEVPLMAARRLESRRRVISKSFRRVLEIAQRQVFTQQAVAPAAAAEAAAAAAEGTAAAGTAPVKGEAVRDSIVRATAAMRDGDWRGVMAALTSADAWARIDTEDPAAGAAEGAPSAMRARIEARLKRATLRTFLFLHGDAYSTVSLGSLAQRFALADAEVTGVVSRMVVSDELQGGGWIRGARGEALLQLGAAAVTPLQALAVGLADKAAQLVEYNEKLFEQRTSGGHGGNGRDGNDGVRVCFGVCLFVWFVCLFVCLFSFCFAAGDDENSKLFYMRFPIFHCEEYMITPL
jgi:translation initiation factor 3 subunit C